MSENGAVKLERNSGVATLTFSHPKANSLPAGLLDELIDATRVAATDSAVEVILLRSEGTAFCAGASFEEFERLSDQTSAEKFFGRFAALFLALKSAPKWVVSRVQGKAVGGGVGLIAIADYAVASPDMAVKLSEYALGIGPYVIGPAIERRIGPAHFAAMAMDCTWRDSTWSYQHGLVDVVVSNADRLDHEVQTLLKSMLGRDQKATAMLKQVSWEQTAHWEALLSQRAKMSAELLIAKRTLEQKHLS